MPNRLSTKTKYIKAGSMKSISGRALERDQLSKKTSDIIGPDHLCGQQTTGTTATNLLRVRGHNHY
jgi:hypothetical protein